MKLDAFDYDLDFAAIDFRKRPDFYRVGRGEQGVLLVEPYKSEILPHWRFKTPEIAESSARQIHQLFLAYRTREDFVGMDMARKFLQMGYTRARRYANHKSGRKYGLKGGHTLPDEPDKEKAECARRFYFYWKAAREDTEYLRLRLLHVSKMAHYFSETIK